VTKVVVKILQGSVVTQIMLGGLTIYHRVANFLQYICAKNYENWLAVDKVIAKISRLTFLAQPCICINISICINTYWNL